MPHSLTCLALVFASAHSRGVPSALPCQILISLGFSLARSTGRPRGCTYKSPILPACCTQPLPPSPALCPHGILAVHSARPSADGWICRRGTSGLCLSHSVEPAFLESRSPGPRWLHRLPSKERRRKRAYLSLFTFLPACWARLAGSKPVVLISNSPSPRDVPDAEQQKPPTMRINHPCRVANQVMPGCAEHAIYASLHWTWSPDPADTRMPEEAIMKLLQIVIFALLHRRSRLNGWWGGFSFFCHAYKPKARPRHSRRRARGVRSASGDIEEHYHQHQSSTPRRPMSMSSSHLQSHNGCGAAGPSRARANAWKTCAILLPLPTSAFPLYRRTT